MHRPYIIAVSALITSEVEVKCQQAGFDFTLPHLNSEVFRNDVVPVVEECVDDFFQREMPHEFYQGLQKFKLKYQKMKKEQ